MEYWNPRVATTTNPNAVSKYLEAGMVSIQSEGTTVWYRGWRIKLLPADPLYATLYTTSVLPTPQPVRKVPERRRLGFDGTTLTILSGGLPPSDLTGRRVKIASPVDFQP
jgi:hypothetical protein